MEPHDPSRRAVLTGILAAPVLARSQPVERRIAYLGSASAVANDYLLRTFVAALQSLGWVEGKNLTVDARFTDGDPARVPALTRELLALRPDVLVASVDLYARSAADASKTLPIVFVIGFDPVGIGLVQSLARPGSGPCPAGSYVPRAAPGPPCSSRPSPPIACRARRALRRAMPGRGPSPKRRSQCTTSCWSTPRRYAGRAPAASRRTQTTPRPQRKSTTADKRCQALTSKSPTANSCRDTSSSVRPHQDVLQRPVEGGTLGQTLCAVV